MILGRADKQRVQQLENDLQLARVTAAGMTQQVTTLQGIIQQNQATIRQLQDAVDAANERYNEMAKEMLNRRMPVSLDMSVFEDTVKDEKERKDLEFYSPAPEEQETA